jgi:LDH2 family malate/lactate/ureidoglycolate dehydrogenase
MLTFTAAQLESAAQAIFAAVGAPADIAEHVARSLVESNLMGHDSHGVIRVPTYVQRVEQGRIRPDARPSILRETSTTAVVRGNWAFGQSAATYGAEVAIRKAREANVAACAIVECNHIGRLGEYAEMIAREGMIGMVVTGGFASPFNGVAPYGGVGRALGTNPYSFAVPAGAREPFVADFATSVVAEGKLQVARAKRSQLPPGLIVDSQGRPSTDPEDFYAGGMLLPFGGHKGYALALLADLLGSRLGGAEVLGEAPHTVGTFVLALRIDAFRPLAEFTGAVDTRLEEIKAVPPAPGFQEVLIPGEPEARSRALRLQEGIPIPEETWEKIVATAGKYGVQTLPAPTA